MAAEPAVCVGVCGFCRPQAELFTQFRALEVQQTFYWPPQLKTAERWRRTAPPDFVFTLKAFQAITHRHNERTYRKTKFSKAELEKCGGFGDTAVVRAAWETTRKLAEAVEAAFVVFQCPPSFAATDETVTNAGNFFEWAKRGKLKFAWEPRHSSWTDDLIAEMCWKFDLVHTVDPLERESAWGEPHYYRLHGKRLGHYRYGYNYPYSNAELLELKQRIGLRPTYCMFNNIQMAVDAGRFERLLQGDITPGHHHRPTCRRAGA
jgi:uncharacterized protein YecE (DUF72 family)